MSSNHLLSMAGWTFLPNLVTGWVQAIWYGLAIRAGDPKPQPGSHKWNLHRRRISIIVISAYLLYTIYEADWNIRKASDFYNDLGISHLATDREIKSRFRRLAAIHHPDKVSSSSIASGDHFVHLKLAQDTLLDPAKRFAYERLGPDVAGCHQCSTIRDYFHHYLYGFNGLLTYYSTAGGAMYLLKLFGYLNWGQYWRWITFIMLFTFELHTFTRPYFPIFATEVINPILTKYTSHPPYLPFQLIQLARQMSVTLYIAFSQIGPLLEPPARASPNENPETALKQQLDRLENIAKAVEVDASRLQGLEMIPFANDPQAMQDIKGKVKEWLVQNTIRSDPEVRDAMGTVLKRKRTDAPAGAKGNR
ncbi:hypothetical protein DSL72_002959 [Monilinia vaccinii-corymbosi]|uniref:J domain-containing protein n=1 Tax=Monilinia vaccinii-corymbosi TaxID=61207 RepID=A0A8A3PE89_9HELO|nr:hypothetical protein DSL72_002959 [Monilinia vaccinii-corymbosi]